MTKVDPGFWKALEELDDVGFVHVDDAGTILEVNAGICRILGYEREELLSRPIEILMPENAGDFHSKIFAGYVRKRRARVARTSPIVRKTRFFPDRLDAETDTGVRFSVVDRQGMEVPISLTVNEVFDDAGSLAGFVACIVDCSEQHALEDTIRHREIYDEYTGLLCWKGFRKNVSRLEKRHAGDGSRYIYSLIHVDIDHHSSLAFDCKAIADYSIRSFARWLRGQIERRSDSVSGIVCKHWNATEFLVYLPMVDSVGATDIAGDLKRKFREVNLGTSERPFHTTLSMGLVTIREGMTIDHAVSRAANACYEARARGHDRIIIAGEDDLQIFEMGKTIRSALKGCRIDIYAQQIIPLGAPERELDSGHSEFEVLCRLKDEKGQTINPDRVFPAAEKMGLAFPLDLYMVREAFSILVSSEVLDGLDRISLNLSGVTISNERACEKLLALIEKMGIPFEKVCFEITESAAIVDSDVALDTVKGLREAGCRIAVDDFGSGYSNYQSLSGWPIDIIKIDGTYIRNMLDNEDLLTDVRGMIASAKARGIEVIAEYAENGQVVQCLIDLGVDYAQGFHFHRPEPLQQLVDE